MSLNSARVSELDVEGGVKTLFNEFLRGWFDGALHEVAGSGMNFPAADIQFDLTPSAQPIRDLDPVNHRGVEIR